MVEQKRGLGRGLSALLGEETAAAVTGEGPAPAGVRLLPIEQIERNPDQPRREFDPEALRTLSRSIGDKGVLQPILVRPWPGRAGVWQIIAGERRWRAAQMAQVRDMPVLIRELDDLQVFEIAVVENVQRADLNAMEEADAFHSLIETHGRTQDQVAALVGKSRSHVANTLRLRSLSHNVRNRIVHGVLSAGHARALIGLPDDVAEDLANRVEALGLSVRQIEVLARQAQASSSGRPRGPRTNGGEADIAALESDLSEALGLRAQLKDRNGRGELILRYNSLEQLDDLCRRLMRG